MARAGRARARVGLGRYDEAIEDASQVLSGFTFAVSRDASPGDRANAHVATINGTSSDGPGQRHATINPTYRELQWKGVDDPRVGATSDGAFGHDGVTLHWRHEKVNSLASPTTLASWRESRLIAAEAYALSGRDAQAIDVLNTLHDVAGIPPVTRDDLPTTDDVIRQVIEERRRELFAEGGHRLRDHLRWRGTDFEVPFLGEPGSIHPDGVWVNPETGETSGISYGSVTCFPVPSGEAVGVP